MLIIFLLKYLKFLYKTRFHYSEVRHAVTEAFVCSLIDIGSHRYAVILIVYITIGEKNGKTVIVTLDDSD